MTSTNDERRVARVRRLEGCAAVVLVLCVALLHLRMLFHAGALWRDEVDTVNVAEQATLGEFWSALEFDSNPALWPLVLRSWLALGGGDSHLRLLGCSIGLGVLAALWWNARLFSVGTGWPGVSWLLLGASPVLFKWGDSLRAYGFGTLVALISLGAIWKLVERPGRRTFAFAAVFALLSVHTLYHNAVLLLALCASGAAVGVRRRDWRRPALLAGLGLLCALSLVIYLPQIAGARDWGKLIQMPISALSLMQRFGEALRASGNAMPAVWGGLWAGALVGCLLCLRSQATPDQDRALFLSGILFSGPLLYLCFLRLLSYPTTQWYYLALMGFLAVGIDAAWERVVDNRSTGRILRLVGCVLLAAYIALPAWSAAGQRRTTVDLCAAVLEERAAKDDLILVMNWAEGITFLRYFRGTTPWITVPEFPDHTLHRFDLLVRKMEESDPLKDVRERLAETLESGRRVWIIGHIPLHLRAAPPPLPPAPGAPTGWQGGPYAHLWRAQIGFFLSSHATQIETVLPALPMQEADDCENVPVFAVSGWR